MPRASELEPYMAPAPDHPRTFLAPYTWPAPDQEPSLNLACLRGTSGTLLKNLTPRLTPQPTEPFCNLTLAPKPPEPSNLTWSLPAYPVCGRRADLAFSSRGKSADHGHCSPSHHKRLSHCLLHFVFGVRNSRLSSVNSLETTRWRTCGGDRQYYWPPNDQGSVSA